MMTIEFKATGLDQVVKSLLQLPEALRNKAVKPAMGRAAKPIVDAAKEYAPRHLGTLKDSIGFNTWVSRDGQRVGVTIGIRRGFERVVGQRTRGKHKGEEWSEHPANYAAQVEFGTSRSEAVPFMRPAIETQGGTAAQLLGTEIEKSIDRIVDEATR